jgi:hypothetical protein
MIEEESFKNVTVPVMSSSLTTRLLDALAPLLNQRIKPNVVAKLRTSLETVIRTAIQVRALSLVGNEYYESVWPSIGSAFDDSEMETNDSGSNGVVVRIPLCPGLRVHSKRAAMVEYHSFEHSKMSCTTLKYVVKSMVVV